MTDFINPHNIARKVSERSFDATLVLLFRPPELKVMAVFTLHHSTSFVRGAIAPGLGLQTLCEALLLLRYGGRAGLVRLVFGSPVAFILPHPFSALFTLTALIHSCSTMTSLP